MKKASVVILTYTHPQNLKRIVAALEPQDCEIIIADDGLGFFHEEDFPCPVKVHTHERTMAQRRATTRNSGAALATTDRIIFLDDDALPSPWLVEEHCAALEDFDVSIGSLPVRAWDIETDMRFKEWGYNPPHLEKRNMFWTANIGIRRDVFEEVGRFDPRYDGEYGYEDADLGEALRRAFKSIYWNPEAVARNLDAVGQWSHFEGEHNRRVFQDKWYTERSYPNEKVLVTLPGFAYASLEWAEGIANALYGRGFNVDVFDFNNMITFLDEKFKQGVEDRVQTIFLMISQQLASAVIRSDPDWVLVIEGTRLHKLAWEVLKMLGVKVGLVLTESPYLDDRQIKYAPYADVVFCNEKDSVHLYENAHYLPASFDRMRHRLRRIGIGCESDIIVAMNNMPGRQEYLMSVDWTDIDMRLIGNWEVPYGHYLYVYKWLDQIHNARLARIYNQAKLGLNVYREDGAGSSLNPRAYELAACGCLQIATQRDENHRVLGSGVVEVSTPAEAERKIRHYLSHSSERIDLAKIASDAVQGCSFEDRIEIIIDAMRRS